MCIGYGVGFKTTTLISISSNLRIKSISRDSSVVTLACSSVAIITVFISPLLACLTANLNPAVMFVELL